MNTWTAQSGMIVCPPGLGIMVKSVQTDVNTQSADDVYVSISGEYGRAGVERTFTAIVPVVGDFRFEPEEDVYITTSDAGSTVDINTVIINYVFYGDQSMYMAADPSRIHRTPARNEWSPPSGY